MELRVAARRLGLASVAVMLVFAPARPDRTQGGFMGLARAELLVRSVAPAGVPATAEVQRGRSLSAGRSAVEAIPSGIAMPAMALLLLATQRGHFIHGRRIVWPSPALLARPWVPRAPPSFRLA
jgi:hypothetical protein